ncbi:uncharacterized protein [Leptinotarsa decemlineata]|uniref:uncharacterized protein n=1 Tax=Leptinotarsa decemlineata TaxID=7539 RepID=UPI003D3054D5
MAKYRDQSTEIDSISKFTSHTLLLNTPANVSETIARNIKSEIVSEVSASSLIHYTTSDDKYDFFWFVGEQLPSTDADVIIQNDGILEDNDNSKDDDINNSDSERKDDDGDYLKMPHFFVTLL